MMKTERPARKKNRINGFCYGSGFSYHVVICTENRTELLSCVCTKNDSATVKLTRIGCAVEKSILSNQEIYDDVTIDAYVIMPDHVHILLTIVGDSGVVLDRVVRLTKSSVTKAIGKKIWQRSYYEHIIRSEKDYLNVLNYIEGNPTEHLNKLEDERTRLTLYSSQTPNRLQRG